MGFAGWLFTLLLDAVAGPGPSSPPPITPDVIDFTRLIGDSIEFGRTVGDSINFAQTIPDSIEF
jgi:hypothetical protein